MTAETEKDFQQWLEKCWSCEDWQRLKAIAFKIESINELEEAARDMTVSSYKDDEAACAAILIALRNIIHLEAEIARLEAPVNQPDF